MKNRETIEEILSISCRCLVLCLLIGGALPYSARAAYEAPKVATAFRDNIDAAGNAVGAQTSGVPAIDSASAPAHTVVVGAGNTGVVIPNFTTNTGNSLLDGVGPSITGTLGAVVSTVGNFLSDPVGSIGGALQTAWHDITHPLTTAQHAVTTAGSITTTAVGTTQAVQTGYGNLTTSAIDHAVSGTNSFLSHPVTSLSHGIGNLWNAATHPVTTIEHTATAIANGLTHLFGNSTTDSTGSSNAGGWFGSTAGDVKTIKSTTGESPTKIPAPPKKTSGESAAGAQPGSGKAGTGGAGTTVRTPSRYQQTGVGPLSGSESTGGRSPDDPIDTGGAGDPNNGAGQNNAGNEAN